MKLVYARESICACGFPTLSPNVPLGTEYIPLSPVETDWYMTCGGCGKKLNVKAIKAHRPGDEGAGWLPVDIFELVP